MIMIKNTGDWWEERRRHLPAGRHQDIQDAADILRPVYDRTNRQDGYISALRFHQGYGDTEETIKRSTLLL